MKPRRFKFIKPLIHPSMKPDEAPLGYLIRVAELNSYKSYRWLSSSDTGSFYVKSHHRLYRMLAKTEWAGCSLNGSTINEVLSLHTGYFISSKLRFCPMCLKELGYYKIQWQYRVSVVCKDHAIWLHDCCNTCGSTVGMGDSKLTQCSCGTDITGENTDNIPDEVLLMQQFLEGTYEIKSDDSLILGSDHGLSKKERIDTLNFFSKWLRGRLVTSTGVSRNLRDMDTARDNMSDVAEALFSGRLGFHSFLKRLQGLGFGNSNDRIDLFTKFYRAFYKDFTQDCFNPYKHYLEQYMNLYWEKPLSKKTITLIVKH